MTTGAKIATELGIPVDETTYPERQEKVVRAGAGVSDEPKFTPGEWKFHREDILSPNTGKLLKTRWWLESDTREDMAMMEVWALSEFATSESRVEYAETMPEVQANAHLIAASPRMYAFIAEFIRWVDDTNGNDKSQLLTLYEDAKSELAKARGE